MKNKIFFMLFFCLVFSFSIFAHTENNKRYEHIYFSVKNKTRHPVALTVVYTDGTWKKPVSLNTPTLLNPHSTYSNTLTSLKVDNDFKSFVSMEAAQIGNERENYVIFAENGNSAEKTISEHIFDGLGKMFVESITNHCHANTHQGYADCTLIIKE